MDKIYIGFGLLFLINSITFIVTIIWSIWDPNIIAVKLGATSLLLAFIFGILFVSYEQSNL